MIDLISDEQVAEMIEQRKQLLTSAGLIIITPFKDVMNAFSLNMSPRLCFIELPHLNVGPMPSSEYLQKYGLENPDSSLFIYDDQTLLFLNRIIPDLSYLLFPYNDISGNADEAIYRKIKELIH